MIKTDTTITNKLGLHATGQRALGHRIQRLGAVADGAQQHRQVDACQQPHAIDLAQALRDVAGRGAKHVGQHQHGALAQLRNQRLGGGQGLLGRRVRIDVERGDVGRRVGKHMQRPLAQCVCQRGMGDQQHGVHGRIIGARPTRTAASTRR